MRAHARIENTIAALKDSGLKRMPFSDFDANAADATRRAQHGAGEMVPTTAPAGATRQSRPQTPQMATMARTRPNSALLKKMDPAPAALVARHTTTTARLPTRRPIDATTARRPQPPPKL